LFFKKFLKQTKSLDDIKFWRTKDKNEVDFIIGDKAFEVKFNKTSFRASKYKKFKKNIQRLNYGWLLIKV
jgi:predicted AAA+ superfamily ATPase